MIDELRTIANMSRIKVRRQGKRIRGTAPHLELFELLSTHRKINVLSRVVVASVIRRLVVATDGIVEVFPTNTYDGKCTKVQCSDPEAHLRVSP